MSDKSSVVRIISVLPTLLGTYGDGGNVTVLQRRLAWRGIDVEVVHTTAADPLPEGGDLYVLGGGEDEPQLAALALLRERPTQRVLGGSTPVLAVCAGLQLLGTSLMMGGDGVAVPGLGVVDLHSTRLSKRALGEVVADADAELGVGLLTGFVNHGGATRLGEGVRPLGAVLSGPGNAGETDAGEGVLSGGIIGSYLHGPVLARNPALADLLLTRATGSELPDLPPGPELGLHEERLAATRYSARN